MAGTERSDKLRRWCGRAGVILVVPLVLGLLVHLFSHVRLKGAVAALEREVGPLDFEASLPNRGQDSSEALELQQLALRLGFNLSLQRDLEPSEVGRPPRYNACLRHLRSRLLGVDVREDLRDEVEAWLLARGGELDELAEAVTTAPASLRFQHHPNADRNTRIPGYLDAFALPKLMVARALDVAEDGQAAQAERLLAAAWRLVDPAVWPPGRGRRARQMYTQLEIALALRRVPGPQPDWERRLAEMRPVAELAALDQGFGVFMLDVAERREEGRGWAGEWMTEGSVTGDVARAVQGPARRFAVAEILDFMREMHVVVEQDRVCEIMGRCRDLAASSPRMAWVSDWPEGPCQLLDRALETERQFALTRHVLEARRSVLENPDAMLATETSLDGRCPGERWRRVIRRDASLSLEGVGIQAQRPVVIGPRALPMEHRESGPVLSPGATAAE